jgi:hypothetical protein
MQRLWQRVFLTTLLSCLAIPASGVIAQDRMKDLAPGVLKQIKTELDPRDSVSLPRSLPGLKATKYAPKYISDSETLHGRSRGVILYRPVWQYEFSFLGQLRQANLKVPDASGAVSNQNVWYLIYRIRDLGDTITYEQVKQSPQFEHMKNDLVRNKPIADEEKFFVPRFSLEGSVMTNSAEGYKRVVFRDTVSPMVLRQIQRREDPAMNLLDAVTMSKTKIPMAKSDSDGGVWGVAIFEGVDPRIDFVSVYVEGLSNAYRIGMSNEQTRMKTLQLNFTRPGDIINEHRDDIEFGIPLVDNPQKQILICEQYNLPGPLINVYHVNRKAADRNVLVAEVDAEVNLSSFQSALTPDLDQGSLPASISQALADAGISVNKQAAVERLIEGKRWKFTEGEETYIIAMEPQFWERHNEGIRFIKSLDHFWIYR